MTREAILKEIQLLPDDMLEAIWNMVKIATKLSQKDIPEHEVNQVTQHKYRTAGGFEGLIELADDFDGPLEAMKEYMY